NSTPNVRFFLSNFWGAVHFLQRLFVCLTSGFLLAADLKWQIIGFSKNWREQEAFPVELRRKEKLGMYLLFYFPKSC
ncbi:hypothetical protein, partial [Streptococcus suis]